MAKSKKEKKNILERYIEKLDKAQALILISPSQITPNEATQLRKQLKIVDSTFNVVKNTLFNNALKKVKTNIKGFDFSGENAVIFVSDKINESAKVVYDYLGDLKKGGIKGGFLDGTSLSINDVEQLAKLPSKEIMIATTVRTIAAPLTGFITALTG